MVTADERFKMMTEKSWEVVACLDTMGTITYSTSAVKKILGYTSEEVVGRLGFDFVHPDDRADVFRRFGNLILKREQEIARFRIVPKVGEPKWIQCTGTNLLSHPAVKAIVIYFHDITYRKHIEEALQESEARYRALTESFTLALDAGKLGTFDWNRPSGRVIWSEQVEKLFGFRSGEFKGRVDQIVPRIHHEDFAKVRSIVNEGLKSRAPFEFESRIILPDGQVRWIGVRGKPYEDQAGEVVRTLGVITDLTDRKRNEVELLRAKKTAENASQAKSRFLANMSHEIRTPLGAVLGFTELIKDPLLDEGTRLQYAEIVDRNGHQLESVLNDILDLSKVEAGKLEVDRVVFSLTHIVDETARLFVKLAAKSGSELVVEPFPEKFPPNICSDPIRIRQILMNVIGNAIKFTPKGGRIVLRLTFDDGEANQFARIDISDTGPGMDEEQKREVFRAFYQGDPSLTRNHGGTGLGLTISKNLSKLLGGDLELLESVVGKGSTFRFKFPIQTVGECEGARRHEPRPKTLPHEGAIRKAKVLLAEDSSDNRLLISQYLKSQNLLLDFAANGRQAVAKALGEGGYDIILMDIQMPELDGYQATKQLRDNGYDGPIIALTAHALREEREHSLEAGCDEHLTKPIDKQLLLDAIARYAPAQAL